MLIICSLFKSHGIPLTCYKIQQLTMDNKSLIKEIPYGVTLLPLCLTRALHGSNSVCQKRTMTIICISINMIARFFANSTAHASDLPLQHIHPYAVKESDTYTTHVVIVAFVSLNFPLKSKITHSFKY